MSRIFYVLIAFVFFSGCGISQQYVIHSPVAIGNPQRTGSVLFECEGPAESTDVIGHYIVIDNEPAIFVEAFSRLQVILASGGHTFNIVSAAAHKKSFYKKGTVPDQDQVFPYGKSVMHSFYLVEGGSAVVRYHAPSKPDEQGELTVD
ncbi:MAG: hypothetical protein KA403_02730 [Candidatus Omnitrophica bacterium]|nr:hypothetical protein [Candidatus Omnitrophota bacterium]